MPHVPHISHTPHAPYVTHTTHWLHTCHNTPHTPHMTHIPHAPHTSQYVTRFIYVTHATHSTHVTHTICSTHVTHTPRMSHMPHAHSTNATTGLFRNTLVFPAGCHPSLGWDGPASCPPYPSVMGRTALELVLGLNSGLAMSPGLMTFQNPFVTISQLVTCHLRDNS